MVAVEDRIWLFVMEPPFGPGRITLVHLRDKLLSDTPREDVDADLFKTLDSGSEDFLQVTRSLVYRTEGHDAYRRDDKILLCSDNESDGYIDPDGQIVYWEGKPPDFWGRWQVLPRYSTNVEVALRLKFHVLGPGRTVSLKELETKFPVEDGVQTETTFYAEIQDNEGEIIRGPVVNEPAVAVLTAMLDYLLNLPVPPIEMTL